MDEDQKLYQISCKLVHSSELSSLTALANPLASLFLIISVPWQSSEHGANPKSLKGDSYPNIHFFVDVTGDFQSYKYSNQFESSVAN